MSRSYKKHPVYSLRSKKSKETKYLKRAASKAVRRVAFEDDIGKGSCYKKYYDSFNICDYKDYETLAAAICSYQAQKGWTYFKSLDDMIKAWYKYNKRK